MNAARVGSLSRRQLTGTWFRAIQPQFWSTLFQTSHTASVPSRFNLGSGQFEVFYLAENHLVALMEVGALVGSANLGSLLPSPHRSWSILNVNVRLSRVVDLTRAGERRKLGTTVQELTGDWRGYAIRHQIKQRPGVALAAPTQRLGEALYQLGNVEGFLTFSAKQSFSRVLVVFPQRVIAPNRITFRDPVGGQTHTIP